MSAMNVGVIFLIEICAVHESLVGPVLPTRDVSYRGEYRGQSGPAADIEIPALLTRSRRSSTH
jgi:hypothetical protein